MPGRFRRKFLIERAHFRCEYCHFPAAYLPFGLHVDHIIAQQHMGGDEESNLAMACVHCNATKGPNLSSIDSHTRQIVRLFDPRVEEWEIHFEVRGDFIVGKTPTGRATVHLLDMNNPSSIETRAMLRLIGIHIDS